MLWCKFRTCLRTGKRRHAASGNASDALEVPPVRGRETSEMLTFASRRLRALSSPRAIYATASLGWRPHSNVGIYYQEHKVAEFSTNLEAYLYVTQGSSLDPGTPERAVDE